MLPKKYRLRRKKDFDRIFKSGRFVAGNFFTLGYTPNDLSFSRFAVVVPKKIEKGAVKRNLIRRRAVEIIRLGREKIRTGFDFVFIAKPAVREKSYKEIEGAVIAMLGRAKMI